MRVIYVTLSAAALFLALLIGANAFLGSRNAEIARNLEQADRLAQGAAGNRNAFDAIAARISEFGQDAELKALLRRLQITVTPEAVPTSAPH